MNDNSEIGHPSDTSNSMEHVLAGIAVPEENQSALRWSPERHLAAAVLTDALVEIRDFCGNPGHQKQVAEDLQWLFSNDTRSPFSFLELCAIFDLEPSYVRETVLHWLRDAAAAAGDTKVSIELLPELQ